MARRWYVELMLRDSNGDRIAGQMVLDTEDSASTEADAIEAFIQLVRDEVSLEPAQQTYTVNVTVHSSFSFEYEDGDGEYGDEDELRSAFESADLDVFDYVDLSNPDETEVYDLEVTVY